MRFPPQHAQTRRKLGTPGLGGPRGLAAEFRHGFLSLPPQQGSGSLPITAIPSDFSDLFYNSVEFGPFQTQFCSLSHLSPLLPPGFVIPSHTPYPIPHSSQFMPRVSQGVSQLIPRPAPKTRSAQREGILPLRLRCRFTSMHNWYCIYSINYIVLECICQPQSGCHS
jgi:hypothetical protein